MRAGVIALAMASHIAKKKRIHLDRKMFADWLLQEVSSQPLRHRNGITGSFCRQRKACERRTTRSQVFWESLDRSRSQKSKYQGIDPRFEEECPSMWKVVFNDDRLFHPAIQALMSTCHFSDVKLEICNSSSTIWSKRRMNGRLDLNEIAVFSIKKKHSSNFGIAMSRQSVTSCATIPNIRWLMPSSSVLRTFVLFINYLRLLLRSFFRPLVSHDFCFFHGLNLSGSLSSDLDFYSLRTGKLEWQGVCLAVVSAGSTELA